MSREYRHEKTREERNTQENSNIKTRMGPPSLDHVVPSQPSTTLFVFSKK